MKRRKPAETSKRGDEKKVNSKVDFSLDLADIPDIEAVWEESHSLRALVVKALSPVLDQLADWKNNQRADYRKILKVMERVARLDRVTDEKHVTADGLKRGVYEMRAHKGHARVMFFYDDDADQTAICTNTYWKGQGDQARAFDLAVSLMELWKRARIKN